MASLWIDSMLNHRSLTVAATIAVLLGTATCWAQEGGGGDTFFIESIRPTESIVPTSADGGEMFPHASNYEIDLRLPSGLSLRRSFERSEIEYGGVVFDTGIAQVISTGASISLGSHTAMNFTRDERHVTDVFTDMLEERTVTGMQFEQGFGGGGSAGSLSLTRALQTDRKRGQDDLRTLIQGAGLDTGLGSGARLSAAFTERRSEESLTRLLETGYRADLRMALSGGEGQAYYDYLERLVEGRSLETRQIDLVAPFAITGGTLSAEHHLREQITDTQTKTERRSSFAVPLDLVWSGARASYFEEAKFTDGSGDEKSVLSFTAPMRLFGHDTTLEHIATETMRGTSWQEQQIFRLSAQFAGSVGVLERTDTLTPSGDDVRRHSRLRIQSPSIRLARAMSLSAGQVRDEVGGEWTGRVSHIALNFEPFEPMDVAARYTLHDRPGGPTTEDRDVRTVLALAPSINLRGSITEQEQVEGSPIILRHMELQRDRQGDADVDLRIGYNSYGAQETETATAMLAQLSVGHDTSLGLHATYTEYDEKKMVPLAEPTTSVELRAGDPTRLGMRAAFSEQASRPAPERTLGLATSAFGGSLRLEFINNPLDPRGKVVMLSDVYEVAYTRTVFGAVGMDLGYRYFLPDDGELADHFFKLRLDGGQIDRGGTVALSYLSGHFVPYPRSGEPSMSLLDVTYEKRWPGDEGRLTLTLSREEAPELSVGIDDEVEGDVKYETRF